jgi:uroporphyrin-III C-methyltransferase
MTLGKVYLVGAGPGDPDLITVRGLKLLRQADVILYDRLVNADLLAETRFGAELIYVGKTPYQAGISQEAINALLVQKAQQGCFVVRLKGGDPFVFGRGGEEALACVQAGIPFEVVPGVSSAIAAPAYAGVPVTHRHLSSAFTVFTGHEDSDQAELDYEALARVGTLVLMMGVARLGEVTQRLMDAGLAPDTPAVCISCASTELQVTVEGSLSTIAELVHRAGLNSPATTVIGAVAALGLHWVEAPQPRKESR